MIFRNGVLALFSLAIIASSSFLYFANKSGNLSRYIASNQQASLYCVTLGLWLSDSDCVKNFEETVVPPPVIYKNEDVDTISTDKVSVVEVVRETPVINNYYITNKDSTNKDSINNQVSNVSPSVVNRDFLTKQVDAVYNSLGRSVSDVNTSIADLTTTEVEEGSNLYYTDGRVSTYLSASSTLTSSLNYWTKSGSQLSYANGNVVIDGTVTATTTELVTNGSFTGSASSWTLGDNASYGTNNVVSAYVGGDSSIRTTFNSVSGKTYKLAFTISGASIPVDVLFSNNSYGTITGKFKNGTHSLVLLTDFTGVETVTFQDTSSVVGSTWTLDNVSIKEVNTAVKPLSVLGFDGESLMSFGDNISGNLNFGLSSFNTNSTGIENSTFGAYSLRNNTSGSYNTANGYSALFSNTTGNNNTASGYDSLSQNTTGSSNVAYGMQSMEDNQTGSNNSSFGRRSMSSNTTGQYNTASGYGALESSITGSYNTAIGMYASDYNISATSTTAVGYAAGYGNGDYYYNQGGVYLGYQSGYSVGNNSDYNTFLGYQSGYNVTTGKDNIFLSTATSSTAIANLTTGSQNILIGANVSLPSATASGQLNIGNIIYGSGNTGTGSTLSTGNIGIGTSSPYAKLSVVGETVSTNFTATNTTATSTFAGNVSIVNRLSLSSDVKFISNGSITASGTSNNIYIGGGEAISQYKGSYIGVVGNTAGSSPGGIDMVLGDYTQVAGGNPQFTLYQSGSWVPLLVAKGGTSKIGILTASPAYSLDVNGEGRFASYVDALNFVATSSTATSTFAGGLSVAGSSGLTVLQNGKVGVGTINPQAKLDLTTTSESTFGQLIRVNAAGGSSIAQLKLQASSASRYAQFNYYDSNNVTIPDALEILSTTNSGGPNTTGSIILNSTNQGAVVAKTSNTERLRVSLNGNVGIATTSPASKLSITQSANTSSDGIWLAGTDGDYRSIYMSDTSGTLSFGGGDTAGAANIATLNSAGAWTNASDRSYKEDIVNLDTKYNLETLMKIEPRFYTMKGSGKPQIGFIAQELKLVLPEVVEGEEGSMGISYGNMVALLVTAIKEINVKVGKIVSEIKVLVLDSITSKVAIFDSAEIKTASISNGLEMKDQVNGEIYCIIIKNGDWDKTRGKCGEVVNIIQESNTNTNLNNSNSTHNNDNSNSSTPVTENSTTTASNTSETTSTTTTSNQGSNNSSSNNSEPTETVTEPSPSPEPTPTTTTDPTPTPSTVLETPVTIEPPPEPSQTEVLKSEPAPEPEPEPAPEQAQDAVN